MQIILYKDFLRTVTGGFSVYSHEDSKDIFEEERRKAEIKKHENDKKAWMMLDEEEKKRYVEFIKRKYKDDLEMGYIP